MKEKIETTDQDNSSKELVLKLIEKVEITSNVDNQLEQLHNLENGLIANQLNNQQSIECIAKNMKICMVIENILKVRNVDTITDEFTRNIIRAYKSQVTEEDRNLNYLLFDKSKASQTAIIKKFMPLVKKIANRYKGNGVDFEDLVSVGNLGIIHAIKEFDPTRNTKFMTYVFCWITAYISRENRQHSKAIRIPSYKYDEFNALNVYKRKFEEIHNRVPTKEDIMDYFGYTELELQELNNLMMSVDSLDRKIADDEDSRELGAIISDKQLSIEEQSENKILSEELFQLFEKVHLNDKEILVLTNRYGLGSQEPMKLEEIASLFNVSRQRISQIEFRALEKLRKSPFTKSFSVYLDTWNKDDNKSDTINAPKKKNTYIIIYEMFPKYTKEEVDLAISKLPEHYKEIVYKKYGNNLDGINVSDLNINENQMFYASIKPLISNYLKDPNYQHSSQIQNLFQRLSNFDEEIIHQAVLILSDEEQEVLYAKFGTNLDSCFKVSKDINKKINQIIVRKLKYRCNNIIKRKDASKNKPEKKKKEYMTISQMFPEYSREDIALAISKLPEEFKNLIYEKYGMDLNNDYVDELSENEKYLIYSRIKPIILKYLANSDYQYKLVKRSLNLFQRLNNYDEEIIHQAVLTLSDEEQETLHIKFGQNLDLCFDVPKEVTKKISYIVYQKLKYRCENILVSKEAVKDNSKQSGRRVLNVYEMLPEYTKEDVDLAISKLPEHYKKIVYKKYGNNLDGINIGYLDKNENKMFYASIKPLILNYLKDPNYQHFGRNPNLFQRLSNFDEEIIHQAVLTLSDEEQETLHIKFGQNLDLCFDVPKEVTKKISYIVYQKLKYRCENILVSKETGKDNSKQKGRRVLTIYEMFSEYSKEEIDLAISKLPEYYKEIVYKKTGSNLVCLDNNEKNIFYGSIKPLILNYLKNPDYQHLGQNQNLFQRLSNFDEEIIHQAVLILSDEEQEVLYAKFGTNLDSCFKVSKDINKKINRIIVRKLKYRCNNIIKRKDASKNKPKKKKEYMTISQMFPEYSKEDIALAISKLPEKFKNLIYEKYGMGLNNDYVDELSENEKYLIYSRIKPIIVKYLANSDYQYKPVKRSLNLFQRLNEYDEETIRFAFKDLDQESQKQCHIKYGDNLDECFDVQIDNSIIASIRLRCRRISIISIQKADSENLFTIFSYYSKEDVKLAVSKLPEDFKSIIYERYGVNLEKIYYSELDNDKRCKLYNHILPLILNYLTNPNYIYKKHRNANQNLYERLSDYEPSMIHEAIQQLTNSQKDLLYRRYGKTFKECNKISSEEIDYINRGIIPMIIRKCKKLSNKNNDLTKSGIEEATDVGVQGNLNIDKTKQISKEIYNNINKFLSNPDFMEFTKALDLEDISLASVAIVFSYVNGTFTSLNEISQFLSVDCQVVKESMKKVLLAYKKCINDELERIIDNPFQKHLSKI